MKTGLSKSCKHFLMRRDCTFSETNDASEKEPGMLKCETISASRLSSRNRKQPRHFTLIELLIVIAIIAILAAMLFPALKNARAAAYSSNCKSNLKQLGMAAQFYRNDFNNYCMMGSLPGNFYNYSNGGSAKSWMYVLNYFSYMKFSYVYSCAATGKRVKGYSTDRYTGPYYTHYGFNVATFGSSEYSALAEPLKESIFEKSKYGNTVCVFADTGVYGAATSNYTVITSDSAYPGYYILAWESRKAQIPGGTIRPYSPHLRHGGGFKSYANYVTFSGNVAEYSDMFGACWNNIAFKPARWSVGSWYTKP